MGPTLFLPMLMAFAVGIASGAPKARCKDHLLGQVVVQPLGDLSDREVTEIQAIVDLLGINLVVVGSAAESRRRNLDTDLPFGYGEETKSDIDYVIPGKGQADTNMAWDFIRWSKDMDRLPGLGIHTALADYPIWTEKERIWFRPKTEPLFLEAGEPNPDFDAFEWPSILFE